MTSDRAQALEISEPELRRIEITICAACLAGEGEECHTPGCALWMHRVDLPIRDYELVDNTVELLHKLADARREYAHPGGSHEELIRHEAQVLDNVAAVFEGDDTWSDLVTSYAPSWRWAEFGEHNPMPAPAPEGADTVTSTVLTEDQVRAAAEGMDMAERIEPVHIPTPEGADTGPAPAPAAEEKVADPMTALETSVREAREARARHRAAAPAHPEVRIHSVRPGNRRCVHEGCSTYGGSTYMDDHETLQHGSCVCGWVGAVRNFPWHYSQRVRQSARPEQERHLHYLAVHPGEATP